MEKTILLIEDDTVLRENTAELLELSDYAVLTASNGMTGVQLAKESLPDAIVCDIMMPELDGFGVLEALSKDNRTKTIPFIFLTAKTERQDMRRGMEMGADDYLTKPFEEDELIGAIESRLAKVAILNEGSGETPTGQMSVKTIHDLKNFIDDNGQVQQFKPDEIVYREDAYSSTVYLVTRGIVKCHKLNRNGKELITGIYRQDDFFGLGSFVPNTKHGETATAMEDTEVVGIPSLTLKDLLRQNHDLTMELMQFLSENLTETKDQLLEMAYGSVRKKTASTLLKFAEKLPKDAKGNFHILRSDLASVAGMATETLIRTLSSFKKDNLIDIEDRNIRILNFKELSRVE
ncbi:response regulator [Pricia sp. S334]|uniref:Response regulator n=1 Tax=Pricia mediterranea TaxID=3076079 RepID=A0ABU3L1A2_9FLAO|nr:response regulator [Pricia sp. S334]MDT7827486.1 response regulator [Pricia sp. S334]